VKISLRFYDAVGYQDDGYQMPTTFVEAEISSDDGEFCYTLGRLFFPPEMMDSMIGSGPVILSVKDERERSGNERVATS
jgi:hypothetical protein